jgi:hypothetical protein
MRTVLQTQQIRIEADLEASGLRLSDWYTGP